MRKKRQKKEQSRIAVNPDASMAPPTESRTNAGKALAAMLVLVVLNLYIFAQVRHFEFIGWDDPLYVTQNTVVSKGFSWQGMRWAFTTGHAANWHPLTWLSLMLDVQLFGVSSGPIHLVNLLFHTVNSLLLFWVLFRMTSALDLSAFVAGMFAVHPLHVESVAWVSERKDVLSTCLLLLAVWAYVTYVRRPARKRYLLVLLLFASALMTKPMVITLPVLLLLIDIWPLNRVTMGKGQAAKWLQLVREKLPLLLMALAAGVVTLIAQRHGGTMGSFEVFPLGTRVANACVSYAVYLGKMLWPGNLSAFYPFQPLPAWAVAASVLGLAGLSFLAVKFSGRHTYFLVGWAWYLITLVPVIGLIQVGDQARADRYTYLPLIGIFVVIAWGSHAILRQKPAFKIASAAIGVASIGVFAFLAHSQAGYWKSAMVLWQHALDSTSRNVHANVNFGFALMDRGELSRAIAHYREALRFDPNFAEAHNALGAALLNQNKIAEASRHFEQALRIKPSFWEAQENMGTVLARQGKLDEAIPYFRQALAAKPADAQLYLNLGLASAEKGELGEAFSYFSEALRLKPDFAEPHTQLGNILWKQGETDKAIGHFREAIRIKPDSADAHNNLGLGLMNKGLDREAGAECAEALRLNPSLPEAYNCLGNILVRSGQEEEAISRFRQAIRIRPAYAEALNNLAAVLINKMQDKEALVHLTEAVRINPDFVEAHNNLAIALINTGRDREAIAHLQKVLFIQPENQQAKEILKIAIARRR